MKPFWMSPFRQRLEKVETTDQDGNTHKIPVAYYVADVAKSRKDRRNSVEVKFPIVAVQGWTEKQQREQIAVQVSEALKAIGIDLTPAQVLA